MNAIPYQPLPVAQRAPTGPAPQFTPDNLRQIHEAQLRYRKIAKAVSVAKFDAWTILIFGAFSILCGFWSLPSFLIGMGLTAVALIELKQSERLKRLELPALNVLSKNQIALAVMLILYCVWMLYGTMTGPSPLAAVGNEDPTVQEYLKPYEGFVQSAFYAVYSGFILVSLLAQGGMAFYYYTRRKFLIDYLQHTPPWVIDMQRAGMKL